MIAGAHLIFHRVQQHAASHAYHRREVKVALINLGKASFTIEPKMRIAQMVVSEVAHCEFQDVEELDATVRGPADSAARGTD